MQNNTVLDVLPHNKTMYRTGIKYVMIVAMMRTRKARLDKNGTDQLNVLRRKEEDTSHLLENVLNSFILMKTSSIKTSLLSV